MEERQINLAKLLILNTLVTVLLIAGLVYILRVPIVEYVSKNIAVHQSAEVTEAGPVDADSKVVESIERVNDAVVSIVITKDVPIYERYYESIDPWGFFGGISVPRVRENGTEERQIGGGSGFIVSSDGLIVTNRHVVNDNEARYSVLLNDGTIYGVEVLARDSELDIAVLQISDPLEKKLTFVSFGDSDELKLGQTVIAIGNALAEFQNSVSVGVVSGLSRSIVASDSLGRSEQLEEVIQTDAAINPGNSGGPLLNTSGEVIGVNVANSRGADNIGFALPAGVVKQVVDSVREYGEIVRPFLGIRYTALTERLIQQNALPVEYGILIIGDEVNGLPAIVPDSPAEKAGLRAGDVILSIDGELLNDRDLAAILRSKAVGEVIELEVLKDGEVITLSIKLEETV